MSYKKWCEEVEWKESERTSVCVQELQKHTNTRIYKTTLQSSRQCECTDDENVGNELRTYGAAAYQGEACGA